MWISLACVSFCIILISWVVTLNRPLIFGFRWFKDYSELDYARSGNEATSDVTVDAGTFYGFWFFFHRGSWKTELGEVYFVESLIWPVRCMLFQIALMLYGQGVVCLFKKICMIYVVELSGTKILQIIHITLILKHLANPETISFGRKTNLQEASSACN